MTEGEKATIIVHSGEFDKVYSALIMGTGALSMGMDVSMYFTFWGLERLKKDELDKGPLSRMNFFGLGKWFMKRKLKKSNVRELDALLEDFNELGGKILACDMTIDIMDINKEDLRDEVITDYCAVGTYIKEAKESEVTLFI
ncbi:MAG: DsrE/DsrF/DrsH-like family protein [Candidatus Thermoplasmatota archaeon]|nr:DsrE/DsrF/DrsH-like family protein [Candidatus Thermoplasmatota archaeon]